MNKRNDWDEDDQEKKYKHKHEHEHHGEHEMLSGELVINGTDQVVINLFRKDAPAEVVAHLKGEPHVVPCNGGVLDQLEWTVGVGADGFYRITLIWSVAGVREVFWKASW